MMISVEVRRNDASISSLMMSLEVQSCSYYNIFFDDDVSGYNPNNNIKNLLSGSNANSSTRTVTTEAKAGDNY